MGFSVDFSTMQGFPKFRSTNDGLQAITKLKVAWADAFTLNDELWDSGNNKFPYHANWFAYVWDIKTEPLKNSLMASNAGDTTEASYDDAVLTVTYSSSAVALNVTGVVSESFDPVDHWFSLGYKELHWKTGGVTKALASDEASAVQVPMPKGIYIREERGIASVPAGCNQFIGHTNNTVVSPVVIGGSFPVGALLYRGTRIRRQLTTAGATRYRLIHRCEYNPQYWNKFPCKDTLQFEYVYNKYDAQFTLPSANINTCFSL